MNCYIAFKGIYNFCIELTGDNSFWKEINGLQNVKVKDLSRFGFYSFISYFIPGKGMGTPMLKHGITCTGKSKDKDKDVLSVSELCMGDKAKNNEEEEEEDTTAP